MGADQSTSRGGPDVSERRTCYYDLLGVDSQASDDDIKKAYRRKALELHPDRNLDDAENATRRFADVQAAYDVLSDPQERAWYDSHREAILSNREMEDVGGDPSEFRDIRLTTSDAIISLIRGFRSNTPMTDAATGFFGTLSRTFDQLAAEEAAVASHEGLGHVGYPPFGRSTDYFEPRVRAFYNTWSGFSTRKSFSWKDKYRLGDAPDRRVRRLMEKENKKLRDDAIRDFNDTVRFLVAFARKRDPRYLPSAQTHEQRQRQLRDSAAAQAARSRAANRAKLNSSSEVPDWIMSRQDNHDAFFSESDEPADAVEIECVVCDKSFKSEKQFEAHERSKKHLKAVQILRWQMRKENQEHGVGGPHQDGDLALNSSSPASPQAPLTHAPPPLEAEQDSCASDSGPHVRDVSVSPDDGPNPESGCSSPGAPEHGYATREDVERHKDRVPARNNSHSRDGEREDAAKVLASLSLEADSPTAATASIGKAKARRRKKAAREAEQESIGGQEICGACHATFASRTKLFSHIRDLGHAQPQAARVKEKSHR